MIRPLRELVSYAILGLAGIAGPVIIPSFSSANVYAQEKKEEPKKEETLEDKLTEMIQRLETLEKKTPRDYTRLVDIYYNFRFDKDKIINIINEAVCSLEKEQSEYKYLETIRLFLSGKKEAAFKLTEEFVKDSTGTPRLKADLSMKMYPNSPEFALELDSSNMPAIIGLFKDAYKKEITAFEGVGWRAQGSLGLGVRAQQIQELLAKKYKPKYNTAIASNVEQPEKSFYLNQLHRSYAEFLKVVDKNAYDFEQFKKNLKKEIKECYLNAIKADPSYYENYIDLGDHVRVMTMTDKQTQEGYEYYQKAYALMKSIYDNPKTEDEKKKKLKPKLGEVCCKKGECLQALMWGFTTISRNVYKEYFHEDQAKEAIEEYTEALRYYESIEEKERTSEERVMILSIRDGISSVKYRQNEIWKKEREKKK